jgi:cob(I)alamin adenosyltransferase
MSIMTKQGDDGTTGLMYGRRVPKNHPRLEACGSLDELTSALGLARATATREFVSQHLLSIQKDLVALMGELATAAEDLPRYKQDGYPVLTEARRAQLEALARSLETEPVSFKDWVIPGATGNSAALDLARAICRRAERQVCALQRDQPLQNPEIVVYLNRLSDVLWLLARWVERQPSPGEGPVLV